MSQLTKSNMARHRFHATLLASITVEANASSEAERKLRAALSASDANLGMLDDEPIVATLEIEGELDLIDAEEFDDEANVRPSGDR
jgi:hypothetical protein